MARPVSNMARPVSDMARPVGDMAWQDSWHDSASKWHGQASDMNEWSQQIISYPEHVHRHHMECGDKICFFNRYLDVKNTAKTMETKEKLLTTNKWENNAQTVTSWNLTILGGDTIQIKLVNILHLILPQI